MAQYLRTFFTIKPINWSYRLTGLLSGILLMIPHIYPFMAPLQLFALLPVITMLSLKKVSWYIIGATGMYLAFGYTVPQVFIMMLWPSIAIPLILYFCVLCVIITLVGTVFLRRKTIPAAIAFGALLTVVDWINFSAVPMWGTAQSLSRPWSYYPEAIQFVSITGITGILFFLGTLQSLTVLFMLRQVRRLSILVTILMLVLSWWFLNWIPSWEKPTGSVTIAAIGWNEEQLFDYGALAHPKGFAFAFADPLSNAATRGAKIVCAPELAFIYITDKQKDWPGKFSDLARQHSVYLAVGYEHFPKHENRAFIMGPKGTILDEHVKTHLIPGERWHRGDGSVHTVEADGIRLGTMICQDDNFTSLSRMLGRIKTSVVAVPTLDWSYIKSAHFQSSIHRAIESRYAVARAARNGISAIISPTGEILAERDHSIDGPGMVVAEVPVYSHTTFYSRFGDWLAGVCGVYLALFLIWRSEWWKRANT